MIRWCWWCAALHMQTFVKYVKGGTIWCCVVCDTENIEEE